MVLGFVLLGFGGSVYVDLIWRFEVGGWVLLLVCGNWWFEWLAGYLLLAGIGVL